MRALRLPFQQRCSYFFEILSYFALSSKCYKLEDLQNNLSQFEKKEARREGKFANNREKSPAISLEFCINHVTKPREDVDRFSSYLQVTLLRQFP